VKWTPALSGKQTTKSDLGSAPAQAAISRLSQVACASQVFNHRDGGGIQVPRDDDETETEGEDDVKETTTVYCDVCCKARVLSLDEAARVDLGDNGAEWTCEKVSCQCRGRREGCAHVF